MKKIFSRILAVGLLSAGIIGVSSCDYLDQKPENLKTTDMIGEIATAIANGLSAEEMSFAMRAQPTYNEGIGAAIEDAMRKK